MSSISMWFERDTLLEWAPHNFLWKESLKICGGQVVAVMTQNWYAWVGRDEMRGRCMLTQT
jgi:hypothetical protein